MKTESSSQEEPLVIDGFKVHAKSDCVPPCPFHAPSDHPLKDAPMHIREDKSYLVERICPHGIGHDDPDSVTYMHKIGESWAGTHGCDGCCTGDYPIKPVPNEPSDEHQWDSEIFADSGITVCRRCGTIKQINGNKPCKGKMAKVMPRDSAIGDEPVFSKALLEYYWGKDWPGLKSHYSDGTPVKPENRGYPNWERYSDEQKEEILELHRLIEEQTKLARIEAVKYILSNCKSDEDAGALSWNKTVDYLKSFDLEASIKESSEDER